MSKSVINVYDSSNLNNFMFLDNKFFSLPLCDNLDLYNEDNIDLDRCENDVISPKDDNENLVAKTFLPIDNSHLNQKFENGVSTQVISNVNYNLVAPVSDEKSLHYHIYDINISDETVEFPCLNGCSDSDCSPVSSDDSVELYCEVEIEDSITLCIDNDDIHDEHCEDNNSTKFNCLTQFSHQSKKSKSFIKSNLLKPIKNRKKKKDRDKINFGSINKIPTKMKNALGENSKNRTYTTKMAALEIPNTYMCKVEEFKRDGKQVFKCLICSSLMHHIPSVYIHMKNHFVNCDMFNSKPYFCVICGQLHSQIRAMKTHMRTVHKQKNMQVVKVMKSLDSFSLKEIQQLQFKYSTNPVIIKFFK